MTIISVLLILSCLLLLGSSRLHVAIRVVAIQGLLLGVLPVVRSMADTPAAAPLHIGLGIWILGLSTIISKGILLRWQGCVYRGHHGTYRRSGHPFG